MKHLLIIALVLAGCGSGGSQSGDDAGVIDCTNDPRVFTYKAGMTIPSASGSLTPARGNDIWTMKVTDTSNQPQAALTMTVLPFMPDHGHGTSVDASITNNHDGTYTVSPLYFFMPGVWRVTFSTATPKDSAVFFFCVPG